MSNPEWQPGAASSANPNSNQGYGQQPAYDQGSFQGQYNQPTGYPGSSIPPQKKSKAGLWVGIGCGALLLLALLVGGGVLAFMLLNGDDKKEVPASEVSSAEKDLKGKDDKGNKNSNGGSAPAPNPAPGGNSSDSPQPGDGKNIPQPGAGGEAASGNLPQQVGSTSLDPSFGDAGIGDVGGTYVSQDMTLVYIASIISDKETQEAFTKYGSGEKKTVGNWTCETKTTNSHTCYTQNSSGAMVYIIGANAGALSPEDVAAWGDEFIAAKK